MSDFLTFTHAALSVLRDDAILKWPNGTRPLYEQAEPAPPGFWIVGDEGVYLMHNGKGDPGVEGNQAVVAYARECNPKTVPFDDWWEKKRATWGGDDGVDYIDPDFIFRCIEKGWGLRIRFEEDALHFEADKTAKW